MLAVSPQSQLKDLTMGGFFFESREPPRSEYSFTDLRAAFPGGDHSLRGTSFVGEHLVGSTGFTHDVPAPPVATAPLTGEPESVGPAVPGGGLTVRWEDATQTVDGRAVDVTGHEVITEEVPDDPNGSRGRRSTCTSDPT